MYTIRGSILASGAIWHFLAIFSVVH